MTEWVSQSEAVRLLSGLGDSISQPALSQYLKGHPEVPRQDGGPGKAQLVDFQALRRSRETRSSRGPASAPLFDAAEPPPTPAEADAKTRRGAAAQELGDRKAEADVATAEFNARFARIRAEEAEGRVIAREEATAAFMAAGVELVRVMEEKRRALVDDLRAAPDARAADQVMRRYERDVRTGFALALQAYGQPDEALPVAAE